MAKPKANTKARGRAKLQEPSFRVFPTLAKIAAGDLGVMEFEDHLSLAIEFDHVLSKAEKAAIRKLYASWADRVVDESRRADDGDAESFERFDALFIGDKGVQGGASRFISAGESSSWLVGELGKLAGVVSVAFGDPPEGGTPIANATVDDTPPKELLALELVHDKARMAALTFAISLYGAKPLQSSPAAVLACWQKFLALVPPGKLTLWGTETTSPMNRKQVTTSTLGLLDKWLAKGAPKREYLAFDIGDEPTYNDAARWRFVVWSKYDDKEDAHFIHLSMPFHVGLARSDEMAEVARELFATGAFRSGTAGPCWNPGCFSSWTAVGNGALHACRLSAKYPAIDYQDTVDDSTTVGIDGIKGVGWLTLLDAKFAAKVGKSSLAKVAKVSAAGTGVMLRAGDTPTLEGRPLRTVFAKLASLIEPTIPRTRWMSVSENDEVHSLGFRVRHAPWPELALSLECAGYGKEILDAARANDEAKTKKVFARIAAAIKKLRATKATTRVPVDDRKSRHDLLEHRISDLEAHVGYAASTAAKTKRWSLALWLYQQALALPGASPTLYAALQIREHAHYVLGGVIQLCVDARDKTALARHLPAATRAAKDQPDIHHALARAYIFLGDQAKALEHVRLGIATYEDSDEFKHDAVLEPIRADIKKLLRGHKKK